MTSSIVIRYLSWEKIYSEASDHFKDLLKCKSENECRILFNSKLHKMISENLTDDEIIEDICFGSNDLFSSNESIIRKLKLELCYIQNHLSKSNKGFNNYLCSIDEKFPKAFKDVLESNLIPDNNKQYIPLIFKYKGNLDLLNRNGRRAIIGTRHPLDEGKTLQHIEVIKKKYPESVCVTGLASGIDSMGVNVFENSICFIGENLDTFIAKEQRDEKRLAAKKKVLDRGLLLTHIVTTEKLNQFTARQALLDRNLFVVLISETVHPIEYTIKSGTISAINHAIKNGKKVYTPKELINNQVIEKFKTNINFY